jgi:Tol biopolymer transport system component
MVLTGAVALTWAAAQDAAIDPVQLTRITADRRNEFRPALSPDGRSLAYLRVGGILTELLASSLDDPAPIALASAKTTTVDPVWSADGNQVCYTDVARSFRPKRDHRIDAHRADQRAYGGEHDDERQRRRRSQ